MVESEGLNGQSVYHTDRMLSGVVCIAERRLQL